jgi:1,4-dihydroxy-2-naphthoate octaprenyltransferase
MKAIKHYFLATRPSFLTITLLGCLIGLFSSKNSIWQHWGINLLAVSAAVFAHAAANVFNDYFDHFNGTDSINSDRVPPFTGGSRYIQENIFSPAEIKQFGLALLLLSIGIGLYLCYQSTWALIPIGILCIAITWMYSAPPFDLMSRGFLGELAITLSWALIVIGFASLQLNQFDAAAILIALAYGCMVANILFVNQIPDIKADQCSKKMTLAVRSSAKRLWIWYLAFLVSAYVFQIIAVELGQASLYTLVTLLIAPLFIGCAIKLKNGELNKALMRTVIPLNILSVHLYAILLCIGLLIGAKAPF